MDCNCKICGSGNCKCQHLIGVHSKNGECLYGQCECKKVEENIVKENEI